MWKSLLGPGTKSLLHVSMSSLYYSAMKVHNYALYFVSSDSIEDYIQTGSSNVEMANQELAKASHHQVPYPQLHTHVVIVHPHDSVQV